MLHSKRTHSSRTPSSYARSQRTRRSAPREAEVIIEDGRITRIRAGEVSGRVRASGGPWRVDGQWWGEPFDHEGWDLELDDGGLYLVAFDRVKGTWLLDGVYE